MSYYKGDGLTLVTAGCCTPLCVLILFFSGIKLYNLHKASCGYGQQLNRNAHSEKKPTKKKKEAFITQTLAGKFDSHGYENVTCNIKHLTNSVEMGPS
jgi:hypothetical protein